MKLTRYLQELVLSPKEEEDVGGAIETGHNEEEEEEGLDEVCA
jgi:hypothetical protein